MIEWYKIVTPALKRLNITHQDVADAMGISQSAVSHKLAGRRGASLEEIRLMVTMAGLELKDLEDTEGRVSTNAIDIELLEKVDSLPEGIAESLKKGWIAELNEMIENSRD